MSRKRNAVAKAAASSTPTVPVSNEAQRAQLSALIDRIDALRGSHGIQYNGKRDLYAVGGYKERLTFKDYNALYERDPIAAEIVDRAPQTTWRTPPEVTEKDKSDKDTPFTKDWEDLVRRLGLWQMCERVDRLSRIGRYGVLFIGARESDDSALKKPLGKRTAGAKDLMFLEAFSEENAVIKSWTTNSNDPNYGKPETYELTTSSETTGFKSAPVLVHHTRVIHVAEGTLHDNVYGRPALRPVFNDLGDYQKITTSTAEGFWQRVAGILQALTTDPDVTLTPADITELTTQLTAIYHDMRKVFVGNKLKLERMGESEPDPSGARGLLETRIATGACMPQRMLFGSETGERASTEDQKSWLGTVQARQAQHAEPGILRRFIDRLIEFGLIIRPGEKGYEVAWPPLMHASDSEIAITNKARADTAAALTPIGGNPTELCGVDKDGNVYLLEFKPGEAPIDVPEPPAALDPKSPEMGGSLPAEGAPKDAPKVQPKVEPKPVKAA